MSNAFPKLFKKIVLHQIAIKRKCKIVPLAEVSDTCDQPNKETINMIYIIPIWKVYDPNNSDCQRETVKN